jgi:hypothetical protein
MNSQEKDEPWVVKILKTYYQNLRLPPPDAKEFGSSDDGLGNDGCVWSGGLSTRKRCCGGAENEAKAKTENSHTSEVEKKRKQD